MAAEEKIKEIEDEIRRTPYNKATQKHIGVLKAKLARLRDNSDKRSGGRTGGFAVKKSGDATVVFVGYPSVGKSTLLNKLTNAESLVAAYAFTTIDVVPGAMDYKGAKIQIFDLPGVITGAHTDRGRGKEVLAVARAADLIVIVLDVFSPYKYSQIVKELYGMGIRLNQHPPDVRIKKKSRGGIRISTTVKLELDDETIVGMLGEYGIFNADVLIRENVSIEQLIDVIRKNCVYVPSLVVLNKMDLVGKEYLEGIKKNMPFIIPISAREGENLEYLKEKIFSKLDIIRIYLKPQGGKAETKNPLIVSKDSNVSMVCSRLHKDFRKRFKYARVWGKSAKFGGQKVGLNHILEDGDVVSIIKKR